MQMQGNPAIKVGRGAVGQTYSATVEFVCPVCSTLVDVDVDVRGEVERLN
jgi:hypothetical protein